MVMKLAVVVPVYNAARHLPDVVRRIAAARPPGVFRTLIVDDGSSDDTAQVARELALSGEGLELVVRPQSGGHGAATKTGLETARTLGADHVACIPCDGQSSPETLPGLVDSLKSRKLDLLQGSRLAGGGALAGGMPLCEFAGRWALGRLERRVFGLALTDFHSGYLIYGPSALAQIPFAQLSNSFDFELEVIASACGRGLAVGEVPIPGHHGHEITHLDPLHDGLRVLRVLWRYHRGRYRP